MHAAALRHLLAGTITAAEKRYLLFASRRRMYTLIRQAMVSG